MAGRTETGWRRVAPWAVVLAGWLAGCALQLRQPALWPAAAVAACALAAALAGVAAGVLARHPLEPARRAGALAACCFAAALGLGFASTTWRAALRLAEALPPALEGQDLELTGVVAELPQPGLIGTRFVFEVEQARWRGAPVEVPRRISLGWMRGVDDDALLLGPSAALRAGQRWRFEARLRQPHGAQNPGGFDLELFLFEQGIRATGYVRARAGQPALLLSENIGYPIERARQAVREAVQREVADPAAAGVLAALAVGDQGAILRDDWERFRVTGVAHLMSISGLHVTMFAWLAGSLIGALWRRSERLATLVPAQSAGRWGGLAAAAAYALLAGWGVPAQRTVAMIAAFVWLSGAGRRWPLHLILLAAAAAVTLLDPWALLQPGFWLSFVAVALLAAASTSDAARAMGSPSGSSPRAAASPSGAAPAALAGGSGPSGRWRELAHHPWAARVWAATRGGVRTQAVATVGLAPLTLMFFQQVSVVGFAANLAAIPLVTLLVTPLALLGVLVPPLWSVAAWLLQALAGYLGWLAALPVSVWSAAAPPAWALAAGLAGGALAVLPLPWHLRALALPLMLPLLAPPVARPAPGEWEAVFMDVGQGNAVLVRTRRHLLVYDTGPMYTPESDAGSRVLVPLLRARGERQVDLLVLSHRDTDHVGGAASLLAAWPVRALGSSLAPDHPLRAHAVPHWRCDAGQRWSWDGVDFEVLHPGADDHERAAGGATKSNALSCVLRVGPPAAGRAEGSAGAPAGAGAGGDAGAAPGADRGPAAVQARAGAGVLLLTGDIEAAQEAALVARHGDALASEVLLVPHHGSRTSSSAAFLDAVAPRVAVVQAAYRSRFGHPAPEVLARYAARGIEVVRSDRCGAWTRPPQDPGFCQREVARRYWHHPGATEAAR